VLVSCRDCIMQGEFTMTDINRLRKLCRQYTTLDTKDIETLQKVANQLPIIAELTGNDVFIDAYTKEINESISLAWGRTKEKSAYVASPVGDLVYPTNEPAVFHTLKTGQIVRNMRGISPEGLPIAQTTVPIINAQQKPVGALIMEKDISKELQEEEHVEMLRHTAEQLSSTLMFLSDTETTFDDWLENGILVLNRQGRITYASKMAAKIYKMHTGSEALGNDFSALISDCHSVNDVLKNLENSMELSIEDQCYRFQAFPLFSWEELSGCVISIHDYTELRKKEIELNAKSLIIQEIHHRVKNNLQNIAAILKLQMHSSTSDIVKVEFSASINRIMAIAFAHDVFAHQTWDTIDLLDLCKIILNYLVENSGLSCDQIEILVTGQSVLLSSNQATSMALVINELITNSIKHGMVPGKKGYIAIKSKDQNGIITLTISDSGEELNDRFVKLPNKGLGLQIVEALVTEKLGGFFGLTRKNGMTEAIVCFTKHSQE